MSKGSTLKEEIRLQQREALQGKSFGYKFKYYLYYYKAIPITIIVLALLLSSIVKSVKNHKDSVLSVAVINGSPEFDYESFMAEFEAGSDVGPKEYMDIDATYNFTGNGMYDTQTEQKFYITSTAGKIDVIIAPASYFDKYAEMGYMQNMTFNADEELLHYVDIVSDVNGTVTHECSGIDISMLSPIIRESWYPDLDEPVYFGVTVESKHADRAADFLEFLQK